MRKVIPTFRVEYIPPVDSLSEFSKEEREKYGLITSTGILNAYRVAFALGEGASRKDSTFDKSHNMHTCCGSKVAWRHKKACKLLKFEDES